MRWLGEERVDLLEISGGNYDQVENMIGDGERIGIGAPAKLESTRKREAYFLDYAAQVRPVATMPLMITGGFRSRIVMDDALQSGELDLIGLGRPLCVMPELCRKLLEGQIDEAPAPERSLFLTKEDLGGTTDPKAIRVMETWSQLTWSCMQLLRMADGLEPDIDMTLAQAAAAYEAHESAAFAAMHRPA